MPRNRQSFSNPYYSTLLVSDPTSLAASQLIWAQHWIPQDNRRCPVSITTRANCKINTLRLLKCQSSAKSSPNHDLVEPPLGTNILKLFEGLRKAESLLAIQLKKGKMLTSIRPKPPLCLPPLQLWQRTTNSKTRPYLLP
jgi:hypothetical protein